MSDAKKKLMEMLERIEENGGKISGFGMMCCDEEENFDRKGRKVLKKMAMKPEWKKLHDEGLKLTTDTREALEKAKELAERNFPVAKAKADLMWATIRNETGIFADATISDDVKTITFYKDEEMPVRKPKAKKTKK